MISLINMVVTMNMMNTLIMITMPVTMIMRNMMSLLIMLTMMVIRGLVLEDEEGGFDS